MCQKLKKDNTFIFLQLLIRFSDLYVNVKGSNLNHLLTKEIDDTFQNSLRELKMYTDITLSEFSNALSNPAIKTNAKTIAITAKIEISFFIVVLL